MPPTDPRPTLSASGPQGTHLGQVEQQCRPSGDHNKRVMTTFTRPEQYPAWQTLSGLAQRPELPLRALLALPQRSVARPLQAAGITLDASRQAIDDAVHGELQSLALQAAVMTQAASMARGEPVNVSEDRAALHMALRGSHWADAPWGADIRAAVTTELERACDFADRARDGGWTTPDGERITDVVNLGIGGSDLGPRMASTALGSPADTALRMHFVSNPDAAALHAVLTQLNPRQTGFIVQSKTFATPETLLLAASARAWLHGGDSPAASVQTHFAAVTAHPQRAVQWGIDASQVFRFWDWVGGRYSLWSAIGLPVMLRCGSSVFQELLAGAHAMDRHFLEAAPQDNLPLQLALIGIWNRNFLNLPTQLVCPYSAALTFFVPFLQQLEMESNGKRTHVDGSACSVGTAPIVWGGPGVDGQHAYFQLVHQGRHRMPVDFIGVREADAQAALALPLTAVHHKLVRQYLLAQAQALACGRTLEEARDSLPDTPVDPEQADRLAAQRVHPGNVPSSILWLERLDARHVGALVALYEHKVFCQAAIWGINPFDQWGVELGKQMARALDLQQA